MINPLKMITDSRASLELTNLAKIKGFYPITSEHWVKGQDGEITTISDWEIGKGKWDEDWYEDLEIDAFSLAYLQKWLRDIFGIIVIVKFIRRETVREGYKFSYDCSIYLANDTNTSQKDYFERVTLYDTYEEALESGLIKALNMIDDE